MEKDSKVVVFGASGLVGGSILRNLIKKGYINIIGTYNSRKPEFDNVKLVKIDLTRQSETEEFFNQYKPDYIFLAAAKVGGILANNTYKADFIYKNLAIAVNMVNSAYKFGVKKLLNLGSSCIYPKYAPQPMKEEYLLTGPLEPTNEPYAVAKISAIKLCRYYNEQYGTGFISVMPTNLYGPNDNFNLETAHVLPALIRKFHLAKLLRNRDYERIRRDIKCFPVGFGYDKELEKADNAKLEEVFAQIGITKDYVVLWGTGGPYREFLHVDDLADACVFLMEKVEAEDMKKLSLDYFVNIGVGEDIKIKNLAKLVKEIVGFEGKIKHDLSKPDGTPRKLLDVSKVKALGWEPKISLEKGIQKTYEWYLSCLD